MSRYLVHMSKQGFIIMLTSNINISIHTNNSIVNVVVNNVIIFHFNNFDIKIDPKYFVIINKKIQKLLLTFGKYKDPPRCLHISRESV